MSWKPAEQRSSVARLRRRLNSALAAPSEIAVLIPIRSTGAQRGQTRMPIVRPLLGRLTQGCIFTCAKAENYDCTPVYGFVITARCDIEQDKVPVVNYLPVVSLDDWLERDGFDVLHSRLVKDLQGSLKGILKSCEMSESILETHPLRDIEASFFAGPSLGKPYKTHAKRLSEIIATLEFLDGDFSGRHSRAGELYGLNDKLSSTLLKELVEHRLNGYYFLPSIDDSHDDPGFVILLREVRHIRDDIARRVANGLELRPWEDDSKFDGLTFGVDKFAMPVGELTSPAVEHVMQTFGQLFGRIGLDDPPKEYVAKIAARRPQGKGMS